MADRTVSVRLRMLVKDYVSGASEAERMTRRLRESQEQLGRSSKKSGKDLSKSAKDLEEFGQRVGKATAITAAGAAAAGGALQYIAPAALAAGAAAGTLPGILGGVAATMGTLKVASIGVGDALGDVFATKDPFARLAPSAKALVAEAGRLKPALIGAQQAIQGAAYKDAVTNLDMLAHTTLPVLRQQAVMLGSDWNQAMNAVTNTLTDDQVLTSIFTITDGADHVFDGLIGQIQPLGVALASLTRSADPLARVIGDRLVGSIAAMVDGINRAKQSGSLDAFFARGAESAGALLSIAGDLLSITGQVIGAVNNQNSAIRGTAESLDAYMASGRAGEDIAGIVDTLTSAYEGMADVLGPLGGIARDALADPGTRDGLATMFDILATGSQALRVVFDLFQALPDPVQSVVITAIALGAAAQGATTKVAALGAAAQVASTKLAGLGVAGQTAGKALGGFAAFGGRALVVLAALQLAGLVFEQFEPAAANVDALTDAVERFASKGEVSGELARVFGEDLNGLNKIAGVAASDGFLAKMGRAAEAIVPPVKSLNEIFQGGSFTEAPERFQALDAAISHYAQTTNDTKGTTEAWNRVLSASGLNADELVKLLPRTTGELTRLNTESATGAGTMAALDRQTRIMSGGLQEAVDAGKDLIGVFNELNGVTINSAEAQIDAEGKLDDLTATLKENGKQIGKNSAEWDISNSKAAENKQATLDVVKAAAEAADAKFKETGSVTDATKVYDGYIGRLRTTLDTAGLTDAQINYLISTYGKMPAAKATPVSAPGAKAATKNVQDFNFAVRSVPPSKTVPFYASVGEAKAAVEALRSKIAQLQSKHIYITGSVRWTSSGDFKVPGGTQLKDRWGGIHTPVAMAGGGITQAGIYPASNPPMIMFAEPETGGEAYIPRRGDRTRNLTILSEAAAWSNARVVPMAGGGVTAAASGLVSVAPPTNTPAPVVRGTALDSIDAYIQARDAIERLNASLKENGRSFSLSTSKGRENYSAIISAVKAAQDAAEAKYEETGSIKAANAAYDQHIAKLRATLKAQKVSTASINYLLKTLVKRPTYDVPKAEAKAPIGSERNIAATEARIGAEEALSGLADHFSLVKPTFNLKDETGRENLGELFDFLKAAEKAAQSVFEQTGNSRTATGVYESYVAQLRKVLTGSGMAKAAIDALLNQYGKIVLTPNAKGGVYARDGLLSLSEGGMFNSASTLYGFAERGTGGELFLPRLGSKRRGEDLLSVGAGWYGGRYTPAGSRDDTPRTINNNLTVHAASHRLTISELQGLQRQIDARARIGRKN